MITGYQVSNVDISTMFGSVFAFKSNGSPSGCIVAYLGTADIDGWIICNGVTRTNNADSRYNALNLLGIGSGGQGTSNYTPPDLQSKFLYGTSINTDLKTTGGAGSVTLDTKNLPSHTHTGTTDSTSTDHAHIKNSSILNLDMNEGDGGGSGFGGNRYELAYDTTDKTGGMDSNATHKHGFTTDAVGENTSFSIIPPYYKVNYIIKL
jgi:microcystin-dependent protein